MNINSDLSQVQYLASDLEYSKNSLDIHQTASHPAAFPSRTDTSLHIERSEQCRLPAFWFDILRRPACANCAFTHTVTPLRHYGIPPSIDFHSLAMHCWTTSSCLYHISRKFSVLSSQPHSRAILSNMKTRSLLFFVMPHCLQIMSNVMDAIFSKLWRWLLSENPG